MGLRQTIQRLLSVEDEDRGPLGWLAASFAVTTAAAIVVATVSKAIFLSTWALTALPWVFVGTGLTTAGLSLGYVGLMGRVSARARWVGVLGLTGVSWVVLSAVFPWAPRELAWPIVVGCPALSALVAVQTWNLPPTLLPTRQAKRLIPVLAASATGGACVGGAMVPVLLPWVSAVGLLGVAGALLMVPLVLGYRALGPGGESDGVAVAVPARVGSGVWEGLTGLVRTPVLWRLSLLVFAVQVASVLVDYQFSGELQARYDRDAMASFLGVYYWVANAAIFGVSLVVTARVVRWLGIGLSMSVGAVQVVIGSALYLAVGLWGGFDGFAIVVGMAFGERVSQFAFGRSGAQMLVSPLEPLRAERARTLIDGVVYRLATLVAAGGLLVLAPTVAELYTVAPVVMGVAVVAVLLGWRLGPHYRAALFRALESTEVDDAERHALRRTVGLQGVAALRRQLRSGDSGEVLGGLEVARTLELSLDLPLVMRLAGSGDGRVASSAVAWVLEHGLEPSVAQLEGLLGPERPAAALAAALELVEAHPSMELLGALARLTAHPEPRVAAHAAVVASRLEGEEGAAWSASIEEAMGSADPRLRRRGMEMALRSGAAGYVARLVRLVRDPDVEVRREAVEAMGRLHLPELVEPVVAALGAPQTRAVAHAASRRFGDGVWLEAVGRWLQNPRLAVVHRLVLIRLIEERGPSPAGFALLMGEVERGADEARTLALGALWRLGAGAEALGTDWLDDRAAEEIARLKLYAGLIRQIPYDVPFERFFLAEVDRAREGAVGRVLRLLAVRFGREALERASGNLGSESVRTRSNAIELLDEKITVARLRAVVPLIERPSRVGVDSPSRARAHDQYAAMVLEQLAGPAEAPLRQLWRWVMQAGRSEEALDMDDPWARAWGLQRASLFDSLALAQLLPVAEVARWQTVAPSVGVIEEGEEGDRMFVVVRGEVEVHRRGALLARLGLGEAFGELALVDGDRRSASVRAGEASAGLLSVERDTFLALIETEPELALRVMRVLSRRLRKAGGAS